MTLRCLTHTVINWKPRFLRMPNLSWLVATELGQPPVPPVTTKLASRRSSVFSDMHLITDYSRITRELRYRVSCQYIGKQATGLDAWASRVKCPARFVSHLHEICIYIYIWVVYSLCFFCCLFITVTWWYVWCIEWASGNQEEVQACLATLWLFIISCYSLYKTTLGLLCSWFENNPHFHKYSMDFHV